MADEIKITKKKTIRMMHALNKEDILDVPIVIDEEAGEKELLEEFVQAVEEIDDAGNGDDVPKNIVIYFNAALAHLGEDVASTDENGDGKGDNGRESIVKLIEALNDEAILDDDIDISDDDDIDDLKSDLIDAIDGLDADDKADVPEEVMAFYKKAKGIDGSDDDDGGDDDDTPLDEKLDKMEFKEVRKFLKENDLKGKLKGSVEFNKDNWDKKKKRLIKMIVKAHGENGSSPSSGAGSAPARKPFEKKNGSTVHEIAATAIMEQKKPFTADQIAQISIAERQKNGDTTGSCKSYANIALSIAEICGVVEYDKEKKKYKPINR